MSPDLPDPIVKPDLAELKSLFGPPPVLSSESPDHYYEIMARFMYCLGPRDFLEQTLIKDVAVATWEVMRLTRHKTIAIERKFRLSVASKARRQQQAKEEIRQALSGQADPKAQRTLDLVDTIDATVIDVEEILGRVPQDFDHSVALQSSIEYLQTLDALHDAALARRDDALEALERYRDNLGMTVRRVSDELIEGDMDPAVRKIIEDLQEAQNAPVAPELT